MAENAERGVVFVLKAQVDPQAKAMVEQFAADIQSKQSAVDAAIQAAAANQAAAIAASQSQASARVQASSGVSQNAVQQFIDQTTQAEQAYYQQQAARLQQAQQTQDAARELQTLSYEELMAEREAIARAGFEREKAIHAQALEDEKKAMEEYFQAVEELRKKGLSDAESITDDEIVLIHELEQAAVKAVENREKADAKFNQASSRERARSVNEALQGIERERATREQAAAEAVARNEKISASTARIVSAISEGTEAVMRFARGFAHLGLIGETDLKKLTDSLLWIQGSTEIFTGLIRSVRQAAEGYDAYRRVVQLTAEAQQALNTATAAGAAIQAGASGGLAGGAASGAAAGAATPLMTRGVTFAAGIGGGLAAQAANVGLAAGGSALAVFGATLAAAASSIFALGSAAAFTSEAIKFEGIGKGATPGGFFESIGTSSMNPMTFLLRNLNVQRLEELTGTKSGGALRDERGDTRQAYIEAEASGKRVLEMQKIRELNLAKQAQDEQELNRLQTARASAMAQQSAIAREITDASIRTLEPEQRRTELIKVIANTEANSALSVEDRARRVIQLSRERLQAEQEIHRTQLQAARDAEREDQRKLDDINKRIESERASMLSAQERFGLMGEAEQENIIDISNRLRQGGAGQLDVQELQRLRGFSGAIDEQIAAEARRRAQAAGFGAVQAGDVQRIQGLEQQRVQIQANIKAQAQVVAQLEIDAKAVADQINQQIDAQLRTIMGRMVDEISKNAIGIKKLEDAMVQRFARM